MSGKWTPGPWFVVPYYGDSLVICTDEDGDNRVCFMATSNDRAVRESRIALDARLISAAPDMVEALRAAANLLAARTGSDDDVACAVISAARAALAKARGETP